MSVTERMSDWLESCDTEFVLAVEAPKFIAQERELHADEFAEWVEAMLPSIIAQYMGRLNNSRRSIVRRRAGARDFAAAADDADDEGMSPFKVNYAINADDVHKRVADMTGADHKFVAEGYTASGKRDLLYAKFHNCIAKKVGKKTTAEVFTEEKYARLQHLFVNGKHKEAEGELGEAA